MGLNSKCKFHGNEHPDFACSRIAKLSLPDKVVITPRGDMADPAMARTGFGLVPTVIFFTDSGHGNVFAVGAPAHLESVAASMTKWTGIARVPFVDFDPLEQ